MVRVQVFEILMDLLKENFTECFKTKISINRYFSKPSEFYSFFQLTQFYGQNIGFFKYLVSAIQAVFLILKKL